MTAPPDRIRLPGGAFTYCAGGRNSSLHLAAAVSTLAINASFMGGSASGQSAAGVVPTFSIIWALIPSPISRKGEDEDTCTSLDNLRDHEEVAVTFCQTVTYKTVQLKGRFLESGELTRQDWEGVERQKNILTEQEKVYVLHSAEHRFKDLDA
jgi:hypothetical protein